MPPQRLHPQQPHSCISRQPLSLLRDPVPCRHIHLSCINHTRTTLDAWILLYHLPPNVFTTDNHDALKCVASISHSTAARCLRRIMYSLATESFSAHGPFTSFVLCWSLSQWCSSTSHCSTSAAHHDSIHLPFTLQLQHGRVSPFRHPAPWHSFSTDIPSGSFWAPTITNDPTPLLSTQPCFRRAHHAGTRSCVAASQHPGVTKYTHSPILLQKDWFCIKNRTHTSISLLQTMLLPVLRNRCLLDFLQQQQVPLPKPQRRAERLAISPELQTSPTQPNYCLHVFSW